MSSASLGRPESLVVGIAGRQHGLLRNAVREARLFDLDLVVVHDVESTADTDAVRGVDVQSSGRAVLRDAEDFLTAAAPGVRATFVRTSVGPARALVEQAVGARAVMIGAADHAWFDRPARASVAADVGRHGLCPVVVVPPAVRARPGDHVVVALERGHPPDGVLSLAYEEADARGCALVMLHALPFGRRRVDAPGSDHTSAPFAVLATWEARYPRVRTRLHLLPRSPLEAEVENVLSRADLLVVGRRGDSAPITTPSPVVAAALRQAVCPVAIAPSPRRDDGAAGSRDVRPAGTGRRSMASGLPDVSDRGTSSRT